MAKFNVSKKKPVTNKCGHAAYEMTDKERLVTQVLTSFFGEEKYYGKTDSDIVLTAIKLMGTEPDFIAKLARYARKEMHLRTVSHVLTALLAHEINGKPYIKEVVADVVERPDDITEILACYLAMYGKPIPNGLKKALGGAIGKFDQYLIKKYSGRDNKVSFRDVLRLTHVKPRTPEEAELFSAIMKDTLPVAERWETELSAHGNKKEVWEKLIDDGKLGYMAALRNLRSMIKTGPGNFGKVLDMLGDRQRVLHSKQLPFRFYAAYLELCELPECTSRVLNVLEAALGYSVENMPSLPGKTVIAVDTSGSMNFNISERSKMSNGHIARLLAALASRLCDEYIVYTFDTRIVNVTFTGSTSLIEAANSIVALGGGTDIELPLRMMLAKKIFADRLIILSDNEINTMLRSDDYRETCQGLADKYREKINPDLWIHAVDLEGYGTQQFRGPRTNIVAGWSERILEFIGQVEQGAATQVEAIENYK